MDITDIIERYKKNQKLYHEAIDVREEARQAFEQADRDLNIARMNYENFAEALAGITVDSAKK